jgi:hypothetical protein
MYECRVKKKPVHKVFQDGRSCSPSGTNESSLKSMWAKHA